MSILGKNILAKFGPLPRGNILRYAYGLM